MPVALVGHLDVSSRGIPAPTTCPATAARHGGLGRSGVWTCRASYHEHAGGQGNSSGGGDVNDLSGPVLGLTGAAGRLGRRAAMLLADHVAPERLVLVTRRPDHLADFAARGVTVRRADFNEVPSVEASFQGIARLLLISTSDLSERAAQHRVAIAAAGRAGVGHIVYTSLSNPTPGSPIAGVTDAHRDTEAALRSFPSSTVLRNATYGDLQVDRWAAAVASGRLASASGAGLTAYVARDDCAAVAARALRDESVDGCTFDVTGPARLTATDLAALLSSWSGCPVVPTPVTADELASQLAASGTPEPTARMMAAWDLAVSGGYLDQCTTVVRELTGTEPRSVVGLMSSAHPELARARRGDPLR